MRDDEDIQISGERRPDPDDILKSIQEVSKPSGRGELTVFFGACAGVGKTYSMLQMAQTKLNDGIAVVAGVIETHGRRETEELLKDIPLLPPLETTYEGIILQEFDLDEALRLKPELILIDELAHTNGPQCRHPKRWMDVQELLDSGINVYTTLNVQHLESFNDIVSGITGITVKETVPDSIIDEADDLILVDIASDILLERLADGKIYLSDKGQKQAVQNFFRIENLTALREMALRRTAEWVDIERTLHTTAKQQTGPQVLDRIAVCIGANNFSSRVIRSAKLLATSLKAPWVALYVENERHYKLSKDQHLAVDQHLKLVDELGGKSHIIHGKNAADSIIAYAHKNGITKIVVGKSIKSHWQEVLYGSLVSNLIQRGGNIDIYVISETTPSPKEKIRSPEKKNMAESEGVLMSFIFPVLLTFGGLIGDFVFDVLFSWSKNYHFFSSRHMMIFFLTCVVLMAVRYGEKAAVITSLTSAFLMAIFFPPGLIHPLAQFFDVKLSPSNFLTLTLFLGISFLIGKITSTLQKQSRYFEEKSAHMENLYVMSKKLSSTKNKKDMLLLIKQHLEDAFEGHICIWMAPQNGSSKKGSKTTGSSGLDLVTPPLEEIKLKADLKEESAVRWSYEKNQKTGRSTNTLPSARGYYLPLEGPNGAQGVLGLIPYQVSQDLTSEDYHLLETFVGLISPNLERLFKN